MNEEAKTRAALAAHAHVIRCNCALSKMRVANDQARAEGEDDAYGPEDFAELEQEVEGYAAQIEGTI